MWLILILFIIIFALIILWFNNQTKNIKENYPKHRFEYKDIVYYTESHGDDWNTEYWILIKDLDTNKLHLIHQSGSLNAGFEQTATESSLVNTKDKKHSPIEFGRKGNLWIKKEITSKRSAYMFNQMSKPYKHLNDNSSISLVDGATAIVGRIEFDN